MERDILEKLDFQLFCVKSKKKSIEGLEGRYVKPMDVVFHDSDRRLPKVEVTCHEDIDFVQEVVLKKLKEQLSVLEDGLEMYMIEYLKERYENNK